MEKQMILTFSASITASDGESRMIAGKIAPYGEVGYTSAGKVVFQEGSINIPNIDKVKLLMSHDNSKVVGRMRTMESKRDGMYATFSVSRSTAGSGCNFASPRTVNGWPIRWCRGICIRAKR
jgi:phage head maturation protease